MTSEEIIDQTILEKTHQISPENTLLKAVEPRFVSSSMSVMKETASTFETIDAFDKTLMKRNQKNHDQKEIFQTEQQVFDFDVKEETTLSPEAMHQIINHLNMSIRQAAEEMGIAHTTLSRYLKKENKRQNNNNDQKMLNWLKEKS